MIIAFEQFLWVCYDIELMKTHMDHVVRTSPHYRDKNGSLVPIGHKGRFLPLENSKKWK